MQRRLLTYLCGGIRGVAIDWVMHCPDRDGMCFYKPCAIYFGEYACHVFSLV